MACSLRSRTVARARRSYSATHQQLKNHLITLQQSIQDTYSEVQVVKAQADRVAQATDEKSAASQKPDFQAKSSYFDQGGNRRTAQSRAYARLEYWLALLNRRFIG